MMAEVLRHADFALRQAQIALVAFTPVDRVVGIERDCERIDDVRKVIAGMLEHLPPEPPLTDEQESAAHELIRTALRRWEAP